MPKYMIGSIMRAKSQFVLSSGYARNSAVSWGRRGPNKGKKRRPSGRCGLRGICAARRFVCHRCLLCPRKDPLPELTEFPPATHNRNVRVTQRTYRAVVTLHSALLQENSHGYDHPTVAACRDWPHGVCRLGARLRRGRPPPIPTRLSTRSRPRVRSAVIIIVGETAASTICSRPMCRRSSMSACSTCLSQGIIKADGSPGRTRQGIVQDRRATERLQQLLHQRRRVEQMLYQSLPPRISHGVQNPPVAFS